MANLAGVEEALAICKSENVKKEDIAMTAVWTLSKLAEANEANLEHIYKLGINLDMSLTCIILLKMNRMTHGRWCASHRENRRGLERRHHLPRHKGPHHQPHKFSHCFCVITILTPS